MRIFKLHIVVIFLVVFVLGTVASSAMAHCGHDGFSAGNGTSMEMPNHNNKAEDADAAACGTHGHGSASLNDSASAHSSDHATNHVDCSECSGASCQNQIRIPEGAAVMKCIDADKIHSQEKIDLKAIFLSIIPNPPKPIS